MNCKPNTRGTNKIILSRKNEFNLSNSISRIDRKVNIPVYCPGVGALNILSYFLAWNISDYFLLISLELCTCVCLVLGAALQNKLVPLPCLRPSLEGPINLKTFIVTNMSKCHMMSQCVTSISFLS
jgi:hypothetical protein